MLENMHSWKYVLTDEAFNISIPKSVKFVCEMYKSLSSCYNSAGNSNKYSFDSYMSMNLLFKICGVCLRASSSNANPWNID